jgi:GNAT superfamily N-acetyltransferase
VTVPFTVSDTPPPGLDPFFRAVLWGSPGGLRYRAEPPDPAVFPAGTRYVSATDEHGLVAVLVLAPMATSDAWMALRLVVAERAQGTGIATSLARFVAATVREPLLGTVEADNQRSRATARSIGAVEHGILEASVVTRVGQRVAAVQRGRVDHLPAEVRPVADQVRPKDVWTLGRSGTVLLAHRWTVTTLGGPLGRAVLPVLRLAGVDAADFRFVSAHGCWGEAAELQLLFGHVLGTTDAAAVITTATVGEGRQRLHRGLARGVAGSLAGRTRWHVVGHPEARWTFFEPVCAR